ncbi:tape measure protein [Chelativorans intermedius]|uniref:Tape measure protein n=1 Tax=Chelativorans intermedius TaxID=515947 RepID=A0ABV6DA51_9HYPH|nr:tape measure protein [Chelativorans intermedius]MCT8999724.1 tape measure protein [Chelativorans intermedius]
MAQKRVSVRLVAEGGRQVKAEFQGVGDAGESNFRRIERQADVTGAVVRRVVGILGAAISTRQLVAYADTWTDLRSRVDLATGSQEAGAAVMDRLAAMARRTYSSLGQTTESWLANATALRELGLTTAESLDFTEALNNAMVVSGARAERAASVQNALSKAMALGTLSGDNLNTVIQSGGRLAELLASELGTTVSGLRSLGQQGAITGDVIRTALIGNLELLREEADSMPATIGDAFTLIGNAALQLVGTWDQMAGATSTVAEGLILLADNLERLAAIGIAFAAFMAGRWVAAFVAARVATFSLSGALTLLRGAIIRTGIGALIVGAGELIYQFTRLVRGAGGFGEALELMGNVARAVWDGIKLTVSSFVDDFRAMRADIEAIWLRLMAYLSQKWADFLARIGPTFNAVSERIGADARIDVFGAQSYASYLEHAASNAGHQADALRARAAETRAHAFDGVREAVEALRAAMRTSGEEGAGALDEAAAAADRVADALDTADQSARAAAAANVESAAQAATGWQAVTEALSEYASKAREIGGDIGQSLVSAFQSAENAVGEFVRTGKLNFSDLVTSLLADLAKLGARRFILGPIADALGGILGGAGGIFADVLHGGGVVGSAGAARMVPAMAFAAAPRMHSGGTLGLRHDEVPAILQRGERVLSRREVQAWGAGGVTININARDAESFRQSRTQIAADIARAVSLGRRGL